MFGAQGPHPTVILLQLFQPTYLETITLTWNPSVIGLFLPLPTILVVGVSDGCSSFPVLRQFICVCFMMCDCFFIFIVNYAALECKWDSVMTGVLSVAIQCEHCQMQKSIKLLLLDASFSWPGITFLLKYYVWRFLCQNFMGLSWIVCPQHQIEVKGAVLEEAHFQLKIFFFKQGSFFLFALI